MRKGHSPEQIAAALRQAEAGTPVATKADFLAIALVYESGEGHS